MAIQIPDEFVPAQSGGMITESKYIRDGNKNQHQINSEKVSDVINPEENGIYVRKNGNWSKLDISYDATNETLIINF